MKTLTKIEKEIDRLEGLRGAALKGWMVRRLRRMMRSKQIFGLWP